MHPIGQADDLGAQCPKVITQGCEVCAAEKKALLSILSDAGSQSAKYSSPAGGPGAVRRIKVFMVNIDSLIVSDPDLTSRLMETFDLSVLPYIIITDRKGTVIRRYCSFVD